jgi:hypothetical protein
VEPGRAVEVMRSLPAGWAQTCLVSPPARAPRRIVLAVLGEAHRVVRGDGTVWLLQGPQPLAGELFEQGWEAHPVAWAARLTRGRVQLTVLTKEPRYFYDTTAAGDPQRLRLLAGQDHRAAADGACPWVVAHERLLRLSKLCVLAGSSPLACGVCGAPWRRSYPSETGARQPTCAHQDPRGRSLVLDPFCRHPEIGRVADRYGRGFLGIADPREKDWQ